MNCVDSTECHDDDTDPYERNRGKMGESQETLHGAEPRSTLGSLCRKTRFADALAPRDCNHFVLRKVQPIV
jgi:hypothetical protein